MYKGPEGETTVIDRVILCSDTNDKLCIKFIIRHTRRPEVSICKQIPCALVKVANLGHTSNSWMMTLLDT